ncbi:MAG: MarR family transcriptional regulator [Candidatus Sumerlaeaceae bacterium]|nr:MarR family transcriptional regulator [Candidatus Sumerlaeaceae bacterium]
MQADIREIESLNYLFLRVMGQIFLTPHSNPEHNEMTGAQKRILYFLDIHGPQKMSDIARLVAVTMPAATAVVDKLVRAGLVARESDVNDRRVIRITMTRTGKETTNKLKEIHEQRLREVLEILEPEKRSELIRSFERIHQLLTEIESLEVAGAVAGKDAEEAF